MIFVVPFSRFPSNFSKYMFSVSLNDPVSSSHILDVEIPQFQSLVLFSHCVLLLLHSKAKSIPVINTVLMASEMFFFQPYFSSKFQLPPRYIHPKASHIPRMLHFSAEFSMSMHAYTHLYNTHAHACSGSGARHTDLGHDSATDHVCGFGQVNLSKL